MPPLTERDKRTLRIGGLALAAYLVLFFGLKGWNSLGRQRRDYEKLRQEAATMKMEIDPYQSKAIRLKRLMESFHLDPSKLSKATVVAQASSAIQKTAMAGGIQLGPIRESPARGAEKELASIQLEGMGQVASIMTFVQRIGSLGYPLIVDSVQISADPMRPGMIKVSLTVTILDFDQWEKKEATRA